MIRSLALVSSLALAGCASAPKAAGAPIERPGFFCSGAPKPKPLSPKAEAKKKAAKKAKKKVAKQPAAPETGQAPAQAPARVEIRARALPNGEQLQVGQQRVAIVAEGATLREIAPRLSDALGLNVVLDPAVARKRIWLWMPDVTLRRLQKVLRDEYDLATELSQGILTIEAEKRQNRRKAQPAPTVDARIAKIAAGQDADQVARTWCRMFATRRGSASVIGESIVFEDTAEALAQADGLVRRLGGSSKPLVPAPKPQPQPQPQPESKPEAAKPAPESGK